MPERPLSPITELTTPGSTHLALPETDPRPISASLTASASPRQSLEYAYESERELGGNDDDDGSDTDTIHGDPPPFNPPAPVSGSGSSYAHIPRLDGDGNLAPNHPQPYPHPGADSARTLSRHGHAIAYLNPSRLSPALRGYPVERANSPASEYGTPTRTAFSSNGGGSRPLPSPLANLGLYDPPRVSLSAPTSPAPAAFPTPPPGGLSPAPRPGYTTTRRNDDEQTSPDFGDHQGQPEDRDRGGDEVNGPPVAYRWDRAAEGDTESLVSVSTAGMAGVGTGAGTYFGLAPNGATSEDHSTYHTPLTTPYSNTPPPELRPGPPSTRPRPVSAHDPFSDRHHPTLHNIPTFPFTLSPSGSAITSPVLTPVPVRSLPTSGQTTPVGRDRESPLKRPVELEGARPVSQITDGTGSSVSSGAAAELGVKKRGSKLLKAPPAPGSRGGSRPNSRPNSRPGSLRRIKLDEPDASAGRRMLSAPASDGTGTEERGADSEALYQALEETTTDEPFTHDHSTQNTARLSFLQALTLRPALTSYHSDPAPHSYEPLHRTASGNDAVLAALVSPHAQAQARSPESPAVRPGLKRDNSQDQHRVRKNTAGRDSRLAGGLFALFGGEALSPQSEDHLAAGHTSLAPGHGRAGPGAGAFANAGSKDKVKGRAEREKEKEKDKDMSGAKRRSKLSKKRLDRSITKPSDTRNDGSNASLGVRNDGPAARSAPTVGDVAERHSIHDGEPDTIVRKSGTFGVRDDGSESGAALRAALWGYDAEGAAARSYGELRPLCEAGVGSEEVDEGPGVGSGMTWREMLDEREDLAGASEGGAHFVRGERERQARVSDDTLGTVRTDRPQRVLVLHNPSQVSFGLSESRNNAVTQGEHVSGTAGGPDENQARRLIPSANPASAGTPSPVTSSASTSPTTPKKAIPAAALPPPPTPPTPPRSDALSAVTPPHLHAHARPAAPTRTPTIVPVSPDTPHLRGISECARIEDSGEFPFTPSHPHPHSHSRETSDGRGTVASPAAVFAPMIPPAPTALAPAAEPRTSTEGGPDDDETSTLAVIGSSERVDAVTQQAVLGRGGVYGRVVDVHEWREGLVDGDGAMEGQRAVQNARDAQDVSGVEGEGTAVDLGRDGRLGSGGVLPEDAMLVGALGPQPTQTQTPSPGRAARPLPSPPVAMSGDRGGDAAVDPRSMVGTMAAESSSSRDKERPDGDRVDQLSSDLSPAVLGLTPLPALSPVPDVASVDTSPQVSGKTNPAASPIGGLNNNDIYAQLASLGLASSTSPGTRSTPAPAGSTGMPHPDGHTLAVPGTQDPVDPSRLPLLLASHLLSAHAHALARHAADSGAGTTEEANVVWKRETW